VHIGGTHSSFNDPYDAIAHKNILLPRQFLVLERFLTLAKPTRTKSEFMLDYAGFNILLPYCSAIPFELIGVGVIGPSQSPARVKASLKSKDNENSIEFSLVSGTDERIKDPKFFGDINAYIIDNNCKLQIIIPHLTPQEAEAVIYSPTLPLIGLYQKESREIFYALSRMGIDFSCLHHLAQKPEFSRIVLRLLLYIDDLNQKMTLRAHLVTEIRDHDFSDEVEIKATGSIPTLHICVAHDLDEERYTDNLKNPPLLYRPFEHEEAARSFLYHLGAGPARLHDGFELKGDHAFALLKSICNKDLLPPYIIIDNKSCPTIIELSKKPTLRIKSSHDKPTRVEVALSLSPEFDQTNTDFALLAKAKEKILVLNEDTLVVLNDEIYSSVRYFAEVFSLERPNEYKSKSVAQVALLLNALGDEINIDADEKLKVFLDKFSLVEQEEDRILPVDLKATLRPYQHDAVAWLSSLHRSGLGGLLGDEMGLGKTLMILTHLARLKEQGFLDKPALVVCPTSVIDVWKEEARIHIPTLKVMKWHGPERQLSQADNQYDIIITSYAILRRDIATHFKDMKFSTLILDEAQYIRNQQTDSFKAAKAINCSHRIALTGTPIENHVGDLYNILDCVEEGILGSRLSFEKQFAQPIEQGLSASAFTLKMLLSPVVTRRRKAEVEQELPPKIENIVHCKLSHEQKILYKEFVNQLGGSLNTLSSGKSSPQNHFMLLSALTRLRQICCHPSLILGDEADNQPSGKLKALREIISECLEMGRKIIIYSQFLKMQALIVKLAQELHPQGALWLHGSSINREDIVKGFQREDGPRIIVVSLKAGGTGITLTQADTVIFADPWWNPAVEDQAVDRAHRIGQKKTVHVIRVIVEDSIESEVLSLAQKKRIAAQSVLHEGFKSAAQLSKEEVRSLLLREIDRIKPVNEEEDSLDD
jgi:superfamily II DNA or RNA helicase